MSLKLSYMSKKCIKDKINAVVPNYPNVCYKINLF